MRLQKGEEWDSEKNIARIHVLLASLALARYELGDHRCRKGQQRGATPLKYIMPSLSPVRPCYTFAVSSFFVLFLGPLRFHHSKGRVFTYIRVIMSRLPRKNTMTISSLPSLSAPPSPSRSKNIQSSTGDIAPALYHSGYFPHTPPPQSRDTVRPECKLRKVIRDSRRLGRLEGC
jgi:hypothetical protein